MATTPRSEPEWEVPAIMPRLVFESPTCGHCGEEVEIDDGVAFCVRCRVEWRLIEDGAVSHPDPDLEGSDVPCTIVPRRVQGDSFDLEHGPCILPSGHEGEHECPFSRVFPGTKERQEDV